MKNINKDILNDYSNVISYNCTKKIIEQMEKCICKIKINKINATGFFCKIPFPDVNNMLPVFITNAQLTNKFDKVFKIYIEEENEERIINLNNHRMTYTDKEKYGVTIIEIKEEDNIKNYMELDDIIINDIIGNNNKNNNYIDKTVYIIQYPEGELSVSYGIIDDICKNKKNDFQHKCTTKDGSLGSPILDATNNKIIGIHKKTKKEEIKFNKGTFLNEPIKEFITKFNNKNNNNSNENLLKI